MVDFYGFHVGKYTIAPCDKSLNTSFVSYQKYGIPKKFKPKKATGWVRWKIPSPFRPKKNTKKNQPFPVFLVQIPSHFHEDSDQVRTIHHLAELGLQSVDLNKTWI